MNTFATPSTGAIDAVPVAATCDCLQGEADADVAAPSPRHKRVQQTHGEVVELTHSPANTAAASSARKGPPIAEQKPTFHADKHVVETTRPGPSKKGVCR